MIMKKERRKMFFFSLYITFSVHNDRSSLNYLLFSKVLFSYLFNQFYKIHIKNQN